MYSLTLWTHSWLRWVIVILLFVLAVRSCRGWLTKRAYTRTDNILRLVTVLVFDLQVMIGLYLYFFLSPVVKAAFEPDSHFMKDSQLRFYAMEHIFLMSIAVIILHTGNFLAKKAEDPQKKFKLMAITIILVFLSVLASIPWPFLPYGRVLFRGF